jgi:PAS domain S-box-containing protein
MPGLDRLLKRYQGVFARYMLAGPGRDGDLERERALFDATDLARETLAVAPLVDEILDLHHRAQGALAELWRSEVASDAERAARERLTEGRARPLVHAITLPYTLAERAHREQLWGERHSKLTALFEQTDALILALDASGQIEAVNPAYIRATGWSPLQAMTLAEAMWRGPLPRQGTQDIQLAQTRRDASRFMVAWTVTPIHGRDGQVRGHFCIGRDITREQQIEDGLRENDKLRAVAVLAGGIAHDFNNLLGSIVGLTELCAMQAPEGSRLARNLGRIRDAGGKAAALVRRLLDFSRQTPKDLRRMRASELLTHAGGLLRAAIPADMDLLVTLADDGPVCVDLVQIEQVLLNLTRNAAHAMRHCGGQIQIVVDLAEPATPQAADLAAAPGSPVRRHLRLRVIDCGEGMAPDVLGMLFRPFFTTKPVGEGTGLGLAAVHGIVGNHEGAIEVASEPGVGTTFSVFLPLVPDETAEAGVRSGGQVLNLNP